MLFPIIFASFLVRPSFDLELIRTFLVALVARLNEIISLTNMMTVVGHAFRHVYITTVGMINMVRFFLYWSFFLFTVSLIERKIGQTLSPATARFAILFVYVTVAIIGFTLLLIVVGLMRFFWNVAASTVRTLPRAMWPLVGFT